MNTPLVLDPSDLMRRVAERVPPALLANVVVIGSIATAWAFRDVSGNDSVATKDIDLLLRPSVDAVATAQMLGQELLDAGWEPKFPNGIAPGTAEMADEKLPALRLTPPGGEDGWFVELLAEPSKDQTERKQWRRFSTPAGTFGLPSFRYMPVAVHGAEETPVGLRVARPACMALAHLLEHAVPDRTPISSLPGKPPRFIKDVGRAIALWWLAGQQSITAGPAWRQAWTNVLSTQYPGHTLDMLISARAGLAAVADYLREAHQIAVIGVLAPHGTTLDAWRRAYAGLLALIEQAAADPSRAFAAAQAATKPNELP